MASLTDEELDRVRAVEAMRIAGESWSVETVAETAARLGREGWMPPDPLADEVNQILSTAGRIWSESTVGFDLMLRAINRGIEIGSGR